MLTIEGHIGKYCWQRELGSQSGNTDPDDNSERCPGVTSQGCEQAALSEGERWGQKSSQKLYEGHSRWQDGEGGAFVKQCPQAPQPSPVRNGTRSSNISWCCLAKTVWLNNWKGRPSSGSDLRWDSDFHQEGDSLVLSIRVPLQSNKSIGQPCIFIIQIKTLLRVKWSAINNEKVKTWVNQRCPTETWM